MLYVVYQPQRNGATHEHVWHVNDGVPEKMPNAIDPKMVVEIQADGDELTWIAGRFRNIPMYSARSVNWFGDMARFIFVGLTKK